jgi:hypothetical protein
MFEVRDSGQQARLIQDIVPASGRSGFDVRNHSVRHRSIGYLDSEYLHLRNDEVDPISARGAGAQLAWDGTYTRVPPLGNIDRAALVSKLPYLDQNRQSFGAFIAGLGASLAAAGVSLSQKIHSLPWLPKRYRLFKGVYTNWRTPTFKRAFWTLPAMILLTGALVGTMFWKLPPVQPGTKHPKSPSTNQIQLTNSTNDSKPATTKAASANTPKPASQATPSPTTTQPSAQSLITETATSSPVSIPVDTGSVIGGMGGGSTPVVIPPVTLPPTPTPTPDPTQVLDPVKQIVNDPIQTVNTTVNSVL